MRVIAGRVKGHKLQGPPGPQTRPMADKIREALFSSLASLGVEPNRALDLYAGTGSIGIEALSRGAAWCTFVDHQKAACAVIHRNLAHTHLENEAEVLRMPVDRALRTRRAPFDFISVDPPYADPDISATLIELSESALVQSGTIIVLGHWPRYDSSEHLGSLSRIVRRCHGDSCFSIFEVVSDNANPT